MTKLIPETREWLEATGFAVVNEAPWLEALTHGSFNGGGNATSEADYQRLEFLGDRVLGLSVAAWLYSAGDAPEGRLSQRLNALVSGATCARIARNINLPDHIRLGKQAREDGGADSDNILGDVVEALIGASFIEHGYDVTRDQIYRLWDGELSGDSGKAKHPKSALQEWAAGNRRAMPNYDVVDRSGPDHAASFTVRVSIHNVGEAEGTASSKSEAEKRAAQAFLEEFG
ncbi:ribonuclease III [Erythrobacter sp. F6033]|uniref:ribonuclease III n=1 Tax=Erythrobacter sp. F6033 TaxID=2926401 RepID=UPI001FF5A42F|nr:ribonuclease III [Erythrobacter sp. F6033]MCK0128616.1 ribonuclease III [Erythrobacter sp. F6033]